MSETGTRASPLNEGCRSVQPLVDESVIGRRSPYLRSVVAATAPARLAERSGSEAWWRRLPTGGVEVVTIDDGEFQRHLVDDGGTITLLDVSPPTLLQRWGSRLALAGWLLGIAGIGAGIALPDGDHLPAFAAVMLATAAVLFVGGGPAAEWGSDLEYRLKARHDSTKGWHPAPALNGWTPATTEQFATVEELADCHNGVAFVRNDGGRNAEVLVKRKRRHCQLWVDKPGNTGLVSETPAGSTRARGPLGVKPNMAPGSRYARSPRRPTDLSALGPHTTRAGRGWRVRGRSRRNNRVAVDHAIDQIRSGRARALRGRHDERDNNDGDE